MPRTKTSAYEAGQAAALEKLGLWSALAGAAGKALPWLGKAVSGVVTNPTVQRVAANPLARHLAGGAAIGGATSFMSGGDVLGGMGRGALLGGGLYGARRGMGMLAQGGHLSPGAMSALGGRGATQVAGGGAAQLASGGATQVAGRGAQQAITGGAPVRGLLSPASPAAMGERATMNRFGMGPEFY